MSNLNEEQVLALVKEAVVIGSITGPGEYKKNEPVKTIDKKRDLAYNEVCRHIDDLYTTHNADGNILVCSIEDKRLYLYNYGYMYYIFRELEKKEK